MSTTSTNHPGYSADIPVPINNLSISNNNTTIPAAIQPSYSSYTVSEDALAHFGYLHSWPLIGQWGNQTPFPIKTLDFETEKNLLFQTLTEARKKITLAMDVATSDNLRRLVTIGCTAIHYTGHGMQNCLAFEDGEGKMHAMDPKTLKSLVSAGGGAQGVKFVFVSACHSESAGNAFVEAGVPHVIAVRTDSQVCDKSAQKFMHHFYLALLVGRTVRESFEIAKEAVRAAPGQLRQDEPRKFLLLPENGDHSVKIFTDIGPGQWEDKTAEPKPHNVPAISDNFMGRNFQIQKIVATLANSKKRLMTITGLSGIGKSALGVASARYIWKRGLFDGVFLISLKNLKFQLSASISTLCSQSLGLDQVYNNNQAFLGVIKNKKYLLVFDGADNCAEEQPNSPRCIRSFVSELLLRCPHCKVLITAPQTLGNFEEFVETELVLQSLAPLDAAQLFYDMRPRDIPLNEFDCVDPSRAQYNLSEHPALKLLAGHPRRIFNAVKLLAGEVRMKDLPPLIENQIKQEEMKRNSGFSWPNSPPAAHSPTPINNKSQILPITQRSNSNFDGNNFSPINLSSASGQNSGNSMISNNNPGPNTQFSSTNTAGNSNYPSPPGYDAFLAEQRAEGEPANNFEGKLSSYIGDEQGISIWKSFGTVEEVKWTELERVLSSHFVSFCGVSDRPLSNEDLSVVANKLNQIERRLGIISMQSFGIFWRDWFRLIENCIRKVSSIWVQQKPILIHGFISRDRTAQMLFNAVPGTFLLRLSENQPGGIAVGFVDNNNRIQHTLIDCNKTGFEIKLTDAGVRCYDTLPELLMKCRLFTTLYPKLDKNQYFSPDEDLPH
jgi:hypothetical protein